MDAFAAVGLAGNIVQFIDFSCKVVDQAASIYQSSVGSSASHHDLETCARQMKELSSELSDRRQSYEQLLPPVSGDHQRLGKLAVRCESIAGELVTALEDLKPKRTGSKWHSLCAALRATWKEDRVKALEKNLNGCRSQLVTELQVMQNEKTSKFLELMDGLTRGSQLLGSELTAQISLLRDEVTSSLASLAQALADQGSQTDRELRVMKRQQPGDGTAGIAQLANILIESNRKGKRVASCLPLLESLAFDMMDFRHSAIHDAHPATYDEVFETVIGPWLRSSGSMFWISGKPGSGKSILMKYIVGHAHTRSKLREYLGGEDPVIASYFFWINGTLMQRSQEGLLRSLLREILSQRPDLVDLALPPSWDPLAMRDFGKRYSVGAWSRTDLLQSFYRLASSGETAPKFCVFVDGLDEYGGDHEELVGVIRQLHSMKIKICIASRPWNVFEEAFGQDRNLKLYMHELNERDIKIYANDKLRNRAEFRSLDVAAPRAEEIIAEVVEKSQGVFLWVILVVRSLVEGLRNQDRLSQLEARLRHFPSDMEEFFGHMFNSIDPIYRSHTSHMFQVALEWERPLPASLYWILDEMEDDPDLPFTMPNIPSTVPQRVKQTEEIKRRINGRCKGLLEVTFDKRADAVVDFLHRTAKDYLMTTQARTKLGDWQRPGFDILRTVCGASVAFLKICKREVFIYENVQGKSVPLRAPLPFVAAKRLEVSKQRTPYVHLRELRQIYAQQDCSNLFLEQVIRADLLLCMQEMLSDDVAFTEDTFIKLVGKDHVATEISTDMLCLILSSCQPIRFGPQFQHIFFDTQWGRRAEELPGAMRRVIKYTAPTGPALDQRAEERLRYMLRKEGAQDKLNLIIEIHRQRWRELNPEKPKSWFWPLSGWLERPSQSNIRQESANTPAC